MMLSSPVHLVISEVGVALFKDHPNALFPFSQMDKDQRYYVECIVLECMREHELCPQLGSRVVVQMGGGCILYTQTKAASSASAASRLLQSRDVLMALCDCISCSSRYGNASVRYAVTGILLQRIVGMVGICIQDHTDVLDYARRLMDSSGEAA
jgi:hypothetical protein